MVLCIKRSSEENSLVFWIRKQYYRVAERLSSIETFQNFTGFGLYDRRVIDIARTFKDPYPYFRGMIAEIGLPYKKVFYDQPERKFGITKNNWYTLYDIGILGIISYSKVPLRLAVFAGFLGAALSFLIAFVYLVLNFSSGRPLASASPPCSSVSSSLRRYNSSSSVSWASTSPPSTPASRNAPT